MNRSGATATVALVLATSLAACGGSSGAGGSGSSDASDDRPSSPDATGDGGDHGDAASADSGDALPPANGPFACGAQTCSPAQFCVNPCCGGAACLPADAGVCPPGFTYDPSMCPNMLMGGACIATCTPAPPYCVDAPAQAADCSNPAVVGRQLACTCG
jgi:hypothetical protein